MKKSNAHMSNTHCIAHRLALCTSQAAEAIPILKKHQQVLTDLFYYFKGSAKRTAKLRDIQDLLEDPILKIKEVHAVRWLSFFTALTTVFRTLDSLLTYFAGADDSDAKASGLKKKIASESFISITYMMMDAMAPVTILSQFFQTENVDVALVKVKLELCLKDLEEVKQCSTQHLQQLQKDLVGRQYHEHEVVATPTFDLQHLTETFINALTENIRSRFPDKELISQFSVLSMRPLSFLGPEEFDNYGNQEITALCDFYGHPQTVVWLDEDGRERSHTSELLITDPNKTLEEWLLAKKIAQAEKYPRDSTSKLWHLLNTYHQDEFPNLIILAKLAITTSIHTAGCERGFSVQNRILSTYRNRLTIEHQDQLMLIKTQGSDRAKFNIFPLILINRCIFLEMPPQTRQT